MKNETIQKALKLQKEIADHKRILDKIDSYKRDETGVYINGRPFLALLEHGSDGSGRYFLTPGVANESEMKIIDSDVLDMDAFIPLMRMIRTVIHRRLSKLENEFEKL